MNIGINFLLWTTHVQDEHFHLFEKLKTYGFHGVEIPLSNYSDLELDRISKAIKDNGLRCTTSNVLGELENPISENKKIRQQAISKLKVDLDMSSALSSEILVGPMHSAHKLFVGRGPIEEEFLYCAAVLKELGAYAQGLSIKLGIEFLNRFECYFLTHTSDADKLCHLINLDNVGILYDTHHANIEENNIAEAISSAKGNINHIHISESHRGTPGTGQVNWKETFSALKSIEYKDWLVVEAFGNKIPDLNNAVNMWRKCFDTEEQLAQESLEFIKKNVTGS